MLRGWKGERRMLIPALAAVAVAATPVVLVLLDNPRLAWHPVFIGWWGCAIGFVAAFLAGAKWERRRPALVAALTAQTLLGLGANWLIPMAIEGVALTGIFLVVMAGGLARLPRRAAITWMLVQSAGLLAIYAYHWPTPIAIAAGIAYGAMQMVVYSATALAGSEREKRAALESTLRELLSTREMLEETVRSSERTEFARDLHDVVGHHLVALGLQLDAAVESDEPRAQIADARRLVRLVLADIREVVADLREGEGVDLRRSLLSLASDGPGPRVVVEIGEETPAMPSGLAQTLLRCAQEALTNARKHASATMVRISIDSQRLTICDDGRGLTPTSGGVGLEMMRERCQAAACAMRIDSPAAGGTTITVEFSKGANS